MLRKPVFQREALLFEPAQSLLVGEAAPTLAQEFAAADLRTPFLRAIAPLRRRVACMTSSDHQLDDPWLMEKLAALDDGKARTIQHVSDTILHHVFEFTGKNPEMDRVALAANGAKLIALGDRLGQRI